jgi:hypothetical protein
MVSLARENGRKANPKNNPNITEIFYNGETYYGWNDLRKKTGISELAFKTAIKHGVDPVSRLGKNGPPKKEEKNTYFAEIGFKVKGVSSHG